MIKDSDEPDNMQSTSMAIDLELSLIKKIEQTIGQKIRLNELPGDLKTADVHKDKKVVKQDKASKNEEPLRGAAFHEKKASNKKDYNYSAGTKAKMNKKKKH